MQASNAPVSATSLFLIFAGLAACLAPPPAQAQTAGALAAGAAAPQGWWLDQTGRAGILIGPCGSQLCGQVEWLKTPLDAAGKPKTDIHNPDAALQARPLCGLPMLGGFVPDGSGGWTGGWVYDPEAGKTYKSVMHLQADGRLSVRGYIGIPLFGRSTVWTRPPAALPQCKGAG